MTTWTGPPKMLLYNLKAVSRLLEIINTMMARTNPYEMACRVLARILSAHKKSLPVGGEEMKEALMKEPTIDLLNKARDLMLVVAAWEVTPHVPKLSTLGPVYEHGIWTCKGRLAKGLENLLGRKNLPILTKD